MKEIILEIIQHLKSGKIYTFEGYQGFREAIYCVENKGICCEYQQFDFTRGEWDKSQRLYSEEEFRVFLTQHPKHKILEWENKLDKNTR